MTTWLKKSFHFNAMNLAPCAGLYFWTMRAVVHGTRNALGISGTFNKVAVGRYKFRFK